MHRLFGSSKTEPVAPAPSLTDVSDRVEQRAEHLSSKIIALENQLRQLNEQLKRTRSPAQQQQIRRKMTQILQLKNTYVKQEEALRGQQMNMMSVGFAIETMKDTAHAVQALQTASHQMKSQMKDFNIDKIEDMQDELADLMAEAEEVSGTFARSYLVPDVNEADLEAELEALGDWEPSSAEPQATESLPSYLSALPSVDEFGLPSFPVPASTVPSPTAVPSAPGYGGLGF